MKLLCYDYFPGLKMLCQLAWKGSKNFSRGLTGIKRSLNIEEVFLPIILGKIDTFFSSSTSLALKHSSIHSKYTSIDSLSGQNSSIRPKEVMVLWNPHRHCNEWRNSTMCTHTIILETNLLIVYDACACTCIYNTYTIIYYKVHIRSYVIEF